MALPKKAWAAVQYVQWLTALMLMKTTSCSVGVNPLVARKRS